MYVSVSVCVCRGHASDLQKSQQALFLLLICMQLSLQYTELCEPNPVNIQAPTKETVNRAAALRNISQLTSKEGRLIS